jgi:drug/metabolite transporter (DMT)-like permease
MTAKARAAGVQAGIAAAGGALAHAGLLMFLAALVLGLSQLGVTPWLSALIVSFLTMGIGYMLVNRGIDRLRETDITPTRAMESIKEDSRWTTRQGA